MIFFFFSCKVFHAPAFREKVCRCFNVNKMPKQCKYIYMMAVMTFVVTAILVACSVDNSTDYTDYYSMYGKNLVDGSSYKLRWIADKKTVGNTRAIITSDSENNCMAMSGWILPVDYLLSEVLQGNELDEAVAYAKAHPTNCSVMLFLVGVTDTSSNFYRIYPYSDDRTLAFNIYYQNSEKVCKLYLDVNESVLSQDEIKNLLGVLKVDSMEIRGEATSVMNKSGFTLTFTGERD